MESWGYILHWNWMELQSRPERKYVMIMPLDVLWLILHIVFQSHAGSTTAHSSLRFVKSTMYMSVH